MAQNNLPTVKVGWPGYSHDLRVRIINTNGTAAEVAATHSVSARTVRRYQSQLANQGHLNSAPHGGGPPCKISNAVAQVLAWTLNASRTATCKEIAIFLRATLQDPTIEELDVHRAIHR